MNSINFEEIKTYRKDIDGLRAIAVIAVIAFHCGILPNGYIGVDVFFVISGYLITGIIYRDLNKKRFSVINFYLRRTRRILPLTLFLTLISLLIGMVVMLPDDLENLAQSVIATNLSGNNILQAITTRNYWDVSNEFKPLMHTWSLGVEEQYYIIYPLLLLIGKNHKKWLITTLSILGTISLVLYFLPFEEHLKFYYIHFRFFELAAGGIAALSLEDNVIIHNYAALFVGVLILIMCLGPRYLPNQFGPPISVVLTLGIIISANGKDKIPSYVLQNKLSVAIGLTSFSLYMWHQIILSYTRYFVVQKPKLIHFIFMLFITIILSVFSYHVIEKPFRNKNKIATGVLLSVLGLLFTFTTFSSLYIYFKGGVIRDVPELGINKLNDDIRGVHAKYNSRIYDYDKSFSSSQNTVKILVIGNSFARDWANVLLESRHDRLIEISYIEDPFLHREFQSRSDIANMIFYSEADKSKVTKLGIDISKIFVIGTKNLV